LKELNKKFDVIAHKLDSMMNGTWDEETTTLQYILRLFDCL
jgi:hypothetical protein